MMSVLHGFLSVVLWGSALRYLYWLSGLLKPVQNRSHTSAEPMHGVLSVLVPVHNEALHLPRLMEDLAQQKTSGFASLEFWLIDDHSTDGSADKIRERSAQDNRFRYILSEGRGKKAALETGLRCAQGHWIVTTDADVGLPPHWLNALLAPPWGVEVVRLGPVWPRSNGRFPQTFFALEQFSMVLAMVRSAEQGHTGLSSGANLAVLRSFRQALPTDALQPELASGDDVFLVEAARLRNGAGAVRMMPQAGVFTEVPAGWSEWVEQRIRWGSKARYYAPGPLKRMAWTVWMGSLACVALPVWVGVWGWAYWIVKAGMEAIVLLQGAKQMHPDRGETRSWRVALPFAVVFQPVAIVVLGLWGLMPQKSFSENRSRSGFGRAADQNAAPRQ